VYVLNPVDHNWYFFANIPESIDLTDVSQYLMTRVESTHLSFKLATDTLNSTFISGTFTGATLGFIP
jgi:hypothetical protein